MGLGRLANAGALLCSAVVPGILGTLVEARRERSV